VRNVLSGETQAASLHQNKKSYYAEGTFKGLSTLTEDGKRGKVIKTGGAVRKNNKHSLEEGRIRRKQGS